MADAPPRPIALPVSAEAIPAELTARPQWVCWRYEYQPARSPAKPWTKVPTCPATGTNASSTDPATWGAFTQALARYRGHGQDGVGFVLTAEDPYVAIDLDGCRDPDSGEIAPWAIAIADRLSTYTEISPSGTGLRLLARGTLPPGGRKKGPIEVYDRARYVTVTGCCLIDQPTTIADRTAALAAWHAEVFGTPRNGQSHTERDGAAPLLTDEQILAKARAAANGAHFQRLWDGDTSGYPSHSEADLALCAMLAFWTRDAPQIDRLFRRSGLYRDKWDARHGDATYGARTIAKALEGQGARYHGSPDHSGGTETREDVHLTDRGNAIRLVRECGGDLRYVYAWRQWLVWRDGRWVPDEIGATMQAGKRVIGGLYAWAEGKLSAMQAEYAADGPTDLADEAERTRRTERQAAVDKISAVLRWALKSESAARLEAMIRLAQDEPGIPLRPSQLDADPWALNVRNGTLDLRTGVLRPHRREDLLTKQCPVPYDPAATCPRWEAFLWRIMAGNQALIAYLQRAIGYSLTGDVSEQCLFFAYGAGANGKSTFLGAIQAMLGDYAMQAMPELFLLRSGEQHPTERADLFGKRFVATIEVEQGRRLAESLVKQLTGGDRIRARRMREDFWEFAPTHKIWLAANHKPVIRGTDHAIWRRIRLIPFTVTIPPDERDPRLPDALRAELPGILAWAVRGCLEWQRRGLDEPPEVLHATDGYRREMDTISQFLGECCVIHRDRQDIRAKSSVLLDAFSAWSGERLSPRVFAERLERLGFSRKMGGDGAMYWLGIGLVAGGHDPR